MFNFLNICLILLFSEIAMVKTDKRDHILDAAEKLFATKGFDATSVRDIGQEADVNIAMLNYYFGSKEGLFHELVVRKARFMRMQLEELKKNQTLSSEEKIAYAIDKMVERMFINKAFTLSISRELSKADQPKQRKLIMSVFLPNLKMMGELMKEGIERKEFRNVDIELTLATLIGTIWNMLSTGDLMLSGLEGKTGKINQEEFCTRVQQHLKSLIIHHLTGK